MLVQKQRQFFCLGKSSLLLRSYSHHQHHHQNHPPHPSAASHPHEEAEILLERKHHTQIVTLNRPKQLNALNHSMVKTLLPLYKQWSHDHSVHQIIIKGSGDKAFCAGGDIKAIWSSKDPSFFVDEYELNQLIGKLKKPHIALIHGVTMGGGVGLSVHGKYRIANEHTTFAMPESAIGFFCDVGGSYFLPRLPGHLGMYLALTGDRLKGKQVTASGVATHFVEHSKFAELEHALTELQGKDSVEDVLQRFSTPIDLNSLENLDKIEQVFSKPSLGDMMKTLENMTQQGDDWAHQILKKLHSASPTSLRVIFRQIILGKQLGFEECFKMEEEIARHMMKEHDFFEGVRALLVDKDKQFNWKPKDRKHVTRAMIDPYFKNYLHLLPRGEEY